MKKIIIKFNSGYDANKEFSFDVNPSLSITIGRDPACQIVVDDKDDVVSRNHALIQMSDPSEDENPIILDSSANGLFVNNKQVEKRQLINHGDKVQLGKNGPVMEIIFDPKPIKATRLIETASVMKATRLETPVFPSASGSQISANNVSDSTSKPAGIGKATLERRIDEATTNVKRESNKKLLHFAIFGVALLICVGG